MSVSAMYWKHSHKAWYCKLTLASGKRQERRLGVEQAEADRERAKLLMAVERQHPISCDVPVRQLLDAFLTWAKTNLAGTTYKWHRGFLRSFSQTISPRLKVSDLKVHHVEVWLTQCYPRTCNSNTRRGAIVSVKRVFGWAIRTMEYLDRDPLVKLSRPAPQPRSICLSHEQWQIVLAEVGAGNPFHDFLLVLLETGTRPQQARILTAQHINWDAKLVHYEKVPGKVGPQDFPLTDKAVVLLRRLALKRPKGPLLLNRDGNPWTPMAISSRFRRLNAKLPFRAFCYLARHSYAMDMIEAGASAGMVSTALGHKDRTVVLKTYGNHFDQRDKRLRECLEEAARQRKHA